MMSFKEKDNRFLNFKLIKGGLSKLALIWNQSAFVKDFIG
jgi:hypothetical protein